MIPVCKHVLYDVIVETNTECLLSRTYFIAFVFEISEKKNAETIRLFSKQFLLSVFR